VKYEVHNNSTVIPRSSSQAGNSLWKSVEKQENLARCCSACSGDYEDPDATAWEGDTGEEGSNSRHRAGESKAEGYEDVVG